MATLITPAELPTWVPGRVMSSSNGLGWEDVSHRSYRYAGLDVPIPPMDHFMIVRYRSGNTPMERSMHGQRTKAVCGPGDFSLLTHAEHSHWYWTECIDVSHTYLSENLMCRVASDVLERTVAEVRLHDLLRSQDPVVTGIVDAITVEALHKGLGGSLYVEALALQLAVHLLRDYASVTYRDSVVGGAISPSRLRRLQEFIEAHMHEGISIEQMAGVVGLGVWTFTKHFKATTGRAPHEFVLDCRVERAPPAGPGTDSHQGGGLVLRLCGPGAHDARLPCAAGHHTLAREKRQLKPPVQALPRRCTAALQGLDFQAPVLFKKSTETFKTRSMCAS